MEMAASRSGTVSLRLAATALIAAAGLGTAGAERADARGCTWEGYKIVDRERVTCSTAKEVLGAYFGAGGSDRGFDCEGFFSGRCDKGTRSFRYRER
jgi:hypothetical protein